MDNGACSYRRFLSGDDAAFDEIMNEYFHNLIFFIDRYVHDIHAAEDIAIDAFADLIVHKNRYNFKVSLKTYLFMIGRSRALDYIKHRNALSFVELQDAQYLQDEATLEEVLLFDERKHRISEALKRLPPDMRVAIHLVYFEEMTYKQAAKVMKKNSKQVDNLIYRGKKELHIILGKDGEQLL